MPLETSLLNTDFFEVISTESTSKDKELTLGESGTAGEGGGGHGGG